MPALNMVQLYMASKLYKLLEKHGKLKYYDTLFEVYIR